MFRLADETFVAQEAAGFREKLNEIQFKLTESQGSERTLTQIDIMLRRSRPTPVRWFLILCTCAASFAGP
jgi:hypothetical protein